MSEMKKNQVLASKYKWTKSGNRKTDEIRERMANGSRKTKRAKGQESVKKDDFREKKKNSDKKFGEIKEFSDKKKYSEKKYSDKKKKEYGKNSGKKKISEFQKLVERKGIEERKSGSEYYRDVAKEKENGFSKAKASEKKYNKITNEPVREKREKVDPKTAEVCPYARKCGSCSYQGMPYDKQLKQKQEKVNALLEEFGKVQPIIGMKNPKNYRNKVHAAFDIIRGGKIVSGVYEAGTHNVVNIEYCQIEDEISNQIIQDIHGLLRSFKIKTYDEDTGYGLLRHVLVRRGFHTGEVMVVLVLGTPILPSKNNFVKALRKLHPEITTIVVNVNNRKTSMILGDKETAIYGKGYIEDTLCGYTFRISPKSFYQVNPIQTEVLYRKAMEFAGLTGKERVVDAYSGIGTIGIVASKLAKEVISVELNKDAVRDAVKNAKMNGIKNISFYQKDAGEFLVEMAEQNEKVDVIFMDPPRAGSDENFLKSVAHMYPKRVVYISCNPETLARDLDYLTELDYKVSKIQPVDMFPFTNHVESVCLITKKEK